MQLVNIGFGSRLSAQRILAALEPESAPIKRMVQEARDRGMPVSYTHLTMPTICSV